MLQIDLDGIFSENTHLIKSISIIKHSPLFENVYSHPAYQMQPFVQTPPLNPHEDVRRIIYIVML
jgi:hypothetical protein